MWLVWLFWTWLLIWLNKDSFQTYYRSCLARITYQVWNCKVTVIFDPPLVQILHLCKCICQNFIPKYFCQFSTTSTSFHTLKQLIYKEKSDICNKLNVWVNKLEVEKSTNFAMCNTWHGVQGAMFSKSFCSVIGGLSAKCGQIPKV